MVIKEAAKVSLGANEGYGIYLIDKLRQHKLPISRINNTPPVLSTRQMEAVVWGGASGLCPAVLVAPEPRFRNAVSFCQVVIRPCDVWLY